MIHYSFLSSDHLSSRAMIPYLSTRKLPWLFVVTGLNIIILKFGIRTSRTIGGIHSFFLKLSETTAEFIYIYIYKPYPFFSQRGHLFLISFILIIFNLFSLIDSPNFHIVISYLPLLRLEILMFLVHQLNYI